MAQTAASKSEPSGELPVHRGDVPDAESAGSARKPSSAQPKSSLVKVKTAGESGRTGFNPVHFFRIAFRSSSTLSAVVNVLWPVVPAAIAVRYAAPDSHLAIFVLSYLAMVPCANMIGFAGQELARKVPHVVGVLTETT